MYNTGLVNWSRPTDSGSTENARLENRKLFKILFKLLYLRFPPLQIRTFVFRTCVFSRPDNAFELRRSTTIVYRTDRQALSTARFCRMGQLATADTWFRTCRTSSFCTVAWQLARFQLTRRIARSLGDSWASCTVHYSLRHAPLLCNMSARWFGVFCVYK